MTDKDPIAEELRKEMRYYGHELTKDLLHRAADHVDSLRADNEAMRTAIEVHNAKNALIPIASERPKTCQFGLRLLADWFDAVYEDAGKGTDQVQQDLRKWATEHEALTAELAAAREDQKVLDLLIRYGTHTLPQAVSDKISEAIYLATKQPFGLVGSNERLKDSLVELSRLHAQGKDQQ